MKIKNKIQKLIAKTKNQKISIREALCNKRGSGLVEYAGIALVVLVIIVVVVLPAMKTLLNVDVFPGLTSKVQAILNFS